MVKPRSLMVVLVLALVAAFGMPPTAPAQAADHPSLVDGHGIHVVDTTWLSDRLVDVTMTTPALVQSVHVRILVPAGYDTDAGRRYPSMYLLHGCRSGTPNNGLGYQGWTVGMHAEDVTVAADTIVVMPDGGGGGFYTDWFNGGTGGPPKWETYHISQLLPWVDQNFRTIDMRSQRAIAGLSMGGFGALSYASRHPDLFGSVASFSGAADLTNPQEETEPVSTVVVDTCAASDGGAPGSTFGSHLDDELNWYAHDPARLIDNLRNTQIYLYTGNGLPGPFDPRAGPSTPSRCWRNDRRSSSTTFSRPRASRATSRITDLAVTRRRTGSATFATPCLASLPTSLLIGTTRRSRINRSWPAMTVSVGTWHSTARPPSSPPWPMPAWVGSPCPGAVRRR